MRIAIAAQFGPVAISFENLILGYDRRPAVHHLTGEIRKGELVGLVGPNGAGKSTLLKGIMSQLRPMNGAISLNSLRTCDMAYLPQQTEVDRSFPIAVFDCVAMGLWRHIGMWLGLKDEQKGAVLEALAAVGLDGFEERCLGTLSGGQFQRVLFARLLLLNAKVILLDEPFRAVDTKTVSDLIALILRWHAEGRTIVAAFHDLDQVRTHFPRTLVLARDLVAWGETISVLTVENLFKARQLCEAWNEDAAICSRGEHEVQRRIA
jgi:zinc/manganese transport system ATP-binding protein